VCFLITTATAQNPAAEKTATIDTNAILDDLKDLLDSSDVSASYALASVGLGNRLFSIKNNQLNARQASSVLVYTPSIGYFHKSGFSISANANFLNDSKKGLMATQYSITPGYDLPNDKHWGFGVSYSRYFVADKYSSYASPIQNDFYTYVSYKTKWIEPGLAFGYSTGNFTEVFKFKTLAGNVFVDTGTYSLRAFSMMASAGHTFDWENVFSKEDGLSFTPTLMVNFSSDSTKSVSHTIAQNQLRLLSRRRRLPKLQGKNSFQAQSVGLSLDLNYGIGKFIIMPQLYLDYYLPATDEKRFTQTFTLSVGYTF
jgi:hypothetical protein